MRSHAVTGLGSVKRRPQHAPSVNNVSISRHLRVSRHLPIRLAQLVTGADTWVLDCLWTGGNTHGEAEGSEDPDGVPGTLSG